MQSVCCLLVGRLTDLFGRRYFILGGNALGLIGCIIAARANSIDVLIGANVLIGIGATVQAAIAYVVGELVPMKHRYLAVGILYIGSIPGAAMGPAVASAFVLHTSAGWRWCYYFMIIINALTQPQSLLHFI